MTESGTHLPNNKTNNSQNPIVWRFHMLKLALVDLDGTVYVGNKLIDGADEAIDNMRKSGMHVRFCTNNSFKSVESIAAKLRNMGIPCQPTDVISSGLMGIHYAKTHHLEKVYFCGSDQFRAEFERNFIELADENTCKNLVIAMDIEYDYTKMTRAVRAALRAEKIVVCSKDKLFPCEGGLCPGCGAIVSSILSVTGRREDTFVGKPDPYMISYAAKECNAEPGEIIVIGDVPENDEAMAAAYGSHSLVIGRDIASLGETKTWDWHNGDPDSCFSL